METKPNPRCRRKLRTPVATLGGGGRGSPHLLCEGIAFEVQTRAPADLLQLAAVRGRVSASHHGDRGGEPNVSLVEALHARGWSAQVPLIVVHRRRALQPLRSTPGSGALMPEIEGAQALVSVIADLVKRARNTMT